MIKKMKEEAKAFKEKDLQVGKIRTEANSCCIINTALVYLM